MLLEELFAGTHHLHGAELVASLFEALDDFANESALHSVRLDHDEGPFVCHLLIIISMQPQYSNLTTHPLFPKSEPLLPQNTKKPFQSSLKKTAARSIRQPTFRAPSSPHLTSLFLINQPTALRSTVPESTKLMKTQRKKPRLTKAKAITPIRGPIRSERPLRSQVALLHLLKDRWLRVR